MLRRRSGQASSPVESRSRAAQGRADGDGYREDAALVGERTKQEQSGGSGGVDLAVHVSAPRAPRLPLCTVIEETWQTFFTKCAGRAVKYGQ
jgi:hypothetical protein